MRHTYILSALAALSAVALVSVSPEQVSAAGGGRGAVPSLDAVPQSASPSGKEPAFPGLEKAGTHTVYAGQPEITEPEMQRFISVLPGFRTWVKSRGVSVRPTVTKCTESSGATSALMRSNCSRRLAFTNGTTTSRSG